MGFWPGTLALASRRSTAPPASTAPVFWERTETTGEEQVGWSMEYVSMYILRRGDDDATGWGMIQQEGLKEMEWFTGGIVGRTQEDPRLENEVNSRCNITSPAPTALHPHPHFIHNHKPSLIHGPHRHGLSFALSLVRGDAAHCSYAYPYPLPSVPCHLYMPANTIAPAACCCTKVYILPSIQSRWDCSGQGMPSNNAQQSTKHAEKRNKAHPITTFHHTPSPSLHHSDLTNKTGFRTQPKLVFDP
ncbi:uncharacterized protein CLUP02_04468 [Colletotrichum lupini]|uniref:Uncharacterized protein n=1 Tax=Colletotrichum lupini TaxID=145971 RepID=A0A9Q8SKG0_9PEZI|nr:uncharacterized protein CLUP02_04468 [Colletotrichum lupini]UQC78989.1 hypothetical protein CLUP02_04468 [Colletotrichum lupini]